MANNRPIGIKKSQFNADTSVADEATLDYVVNGENIKIKHSDFVNTLGVSGSIGQVGDPLSNPVLDVQGTFNGIRNLEEGFGISINQSPQNGLEIATDFSFDQTGAVLVDDPLAPAANFRSLVAGQGITHTESAGVITTAVTDDLIPPENRVVINNIDDFDVQDANSIYLQDNTAYEIGSIARLTTSKNFIVGKGVALISLNPGRTNGVIHYTGTGDMFVGVDSQVFHTDQITVQAENCNQIFNFSDTVRRTIFNASVFTIGPDVGVLGANKVGTFSGIQSVLIDFSSAASSGSLGVNDGITLVGSIGLLSISKLAFVSFSPTYVGLDFGSSVIDTAYEISNFVNVGLAVGSVGISGLPNSGNLAAGLLGTYTGCDFIGPITPIVGIDPKDIQIDFDNCAPIQDSEDVIEIEMSADQTVTINTSGVFEPIAGGNWSSINPSRFSVDADGIVTYLGLSKKSFLISFSFTIEKVGGGADDIGLGISINGGVIEDKTISSTTSSTPNRVTKVTRFLLNPSDTIQIYAANFTSTSNVIVQEKGGNFVI